MTLGSKTHAVILHNHEHTKAILHMLASVLVLPSGLVALSERECGGRAELWDRGAVVLASLPNAGPELLPVRGGSAHL